MRLHHLLHPRPSHPTVKPQKDMRKMLPENMSWCYGLVEDEEKNVVLAEVYHDGPGKLTMWCPVSKKEIRSKKTLKLVLGDITGQLKQGIIFTQKDFDKKP